jgi:hypothetical protein
MTLRLVQSFRFNGVAFQVYLCETAGDGLPVHDHDFNHLTRCEVGAIEAFDDRGPIKTATPADVPFEFRAGRRHGVRALTDGARFVNIFPA